MSIFILDQVVDRPRMLVGCVAVGVTEFYTYSLQGPCSRCGDVSWPGLSLQYMRYGLGRHTVRRAFFYLDIDALSVELPVEV